MNDKKREPRNIFASSRRSILLLSTFAICCSVLAATVSLAQEEAGDDAATPVRNTHQWGAVTLFHGLPSDRVRAIAQDADGVMWFGTDHGLARYDGRRTQAIVGTDAPTNRVHALTIDGSGALWVGTDAGAWVLRAGKWRRIEEAKGEKITAILRRERGRVLLVAEAGSIYEVVSVGDDAATQIVTKHILRKPDDESGSEKFELTTAAIVAGEVLLGTHKRGLVRAQIETHGEAPSRDEATTRADTTGIAAAKDTTSVAATNEKDGNAHPVPTDLRPLTSDLSLNRVAAYEIMSRPRPFFVEAMDVDARGRLWFGAQTTGGDGGLYEAGDLFRPVKIPLNTGTVTTVKFDARGDLWIGTSERGALHLRGNRLLERWTFEATAGSLVSDTIYTIFVDREDVVWFGTDRGVCRYDRHAMRQERAAQDAESNFVRVLFEMSDGHVLCGTNRGLFVRERLTADDASAVESSWREVAEFMGRTVYAIAEDAGGRLFIGTANGLYLGTAQAHGGGDASRVSFVRVDPLTLEAVATSAQGSSNESVRAICAFRGAVYAAIFGRGVVRLPVNGAGGQALTIAKDATISKNDAGVRDVLSLHAEGDARLWIGTARAGVFSFDGDDVRAASNLESLRGAAVWSIASTGSSADKNYKTGAGVMLWFATERGLYCLRGGELTQVVQGFDVRCVIAAGETEDARGQVWCATVGGGLMRVRRDGEANRFIVARFDTEQGLPSQSAFAVLSVRGGATGGSGADKASDADNASDTNTASDVGNFVDRRGMTSLLIGTNRGVARYEPGGVAPLLQIVRVLTQRLHDPEEIKREGLRLEYPQTSLALDVAAMSSRTYPESFQYSFTVRDAAGRIVERQLAADASLLVEGLRAGRYTIEARAYTADLVASAPLAFSFDVASAPFPFTTLSLSALLLIALTALLWGWMQNRRIVRAGVELTTTNRELSRARLSLASEAETERRRIARDLHDQTLADLRRLLLLSDVAIEGADAAANAHGSNGDGSSRNADGNGRFDKALFRREIENISGEVRRICEDLSPSVLENVGFAAALEWALTEAVAQLPHERKFVYEFICDEHLDDELNLTPLARMQIYRILQEVLNNVCRHADATRVRLSAAVAEDGSFVLTLEDDGRGFVPDARTRKRGRGLANIAARAGLVEAEVAWTRRDGGGTIWILRKAPAKKIGSSVD